MNITLEDALGMCGLTEDEVLAIAEHEHIEEMAAVAMGNDLLQSNEGTVKIMQFLIEDIQNAQAHDKKAHAAALKIVLKHFVENHMQPRS